MNKNLHNEHLNDPEFKGLDTDQKILQYSSQYKVPATLTKEEALLKLKAKIAEGRHSTELSHHTKIRSIYWVSSAAASIAILFGIWYLILRKPATEVMADKGQHTEYQLPDGSQVTMNAESKITFKKGSFIKNRLLTLDGEAFFSVKKGKSFVVNTKLADIKVLGTSFNIFSRDNSFKVSCLTGKVSVTSKNNAVIITPGESVSFTNGQLVKFEDKNINTIANWRSGEFYFENAPLSSVFKEIERQFNVTFVATNVAEKYFTGSFTNKNLVNALDIVCIPMGLTYEIGTNSKVFISERIK
jgi:transmembrane sensor